MKIYIHIGFGKTGTTSIQTWLAHKSARRQIDAFYYPLPANFGLNAEFDYPGNAFFLFKELRGSQSEDDWNQILDDFFLNHKVFEQDRDILLSSEDFGVLEHSCVLFLIGYCQRKGLAVVPCIYVAASRENCFIVLCPSRYSQSVI